MGTFFSLTVDPVPGVSYSVWDNTGDRIDVNRSGATTEFDSYGEGENPLFMVVMQNFGLDSLVTIKSNVKLARIPDPDDGRELRVGESVQGFLDYRRDIDSYLIRVSKGEEIEARVQAVAPLSIGIDHPSAAPYQFAGPGEPVRGSLGVSTNAYKAPVDAMYTLFVWDPDGDPIGYTLSVAMPQSYVRAKTPRQPPLSIESPLGPMLRHKGDLVPFEIEYPASVTGREEQLTGAEIFEQGRRGETFAIEEMDLSLFPNAMPEEYLRRSFVMSQIPIELRKVISTKRTTVDGAPVVIQEVESHDGRMKGTRLGYVHEGKTGVGVFFYARADVFEEWKEMVDYSLSTFKLR